jgi:DNA-binding transcriptional LysR family regulator
MYRISRFVMASECALSNLRIADLELFVTAARMKNLGKAAVLHHLSQSAASAAICRVEAALGFAICTHEKRQFRLQRDGEFILPHVENWLRTIRDVFSQRNSVPIRVSTTHAIAQVYIPPILAVENIELTLSRPDIAYGALLRGEIDVALVLDNERWEGVITDEIAKGLFQLYSSKSTAAPVPVLLPEDQLEVITLQQRWKQMHGTLIPVKARIPSWSLIADICTHSREVGFLPDFLALQYRLVPMKWQPAPSAYRILALYKNTCPLFQKRLQKIFAEWTLSSPQAKRVL